MSRTLKLIDQLLAMGKNLQELERDRDAVRVFKRLAALHGVPAEVVEETQLRLGEIYLRHRKYVRARRHLAVALLYGPEKARYHFLMASALNTAKNGKPEKAAGHYRKSLQIDPQQPSCLSDYGLLALCMGQMKRGLQAIRRAVELAPDDPSIIAKVVEGLCEAGRTKETRVLLREAMFGHPRDGRFRKLYNDFMFNEVRDEQEASRRAEPRRRTTNSRPMLLPFVRPAAGPASAAFDGNVIRQDEESSLPPPHRPAQLRRSDRKHG